MKKLAVLLAIGLSAFSLSVYAKAEALDHIVAVVNDDVITQSEFNEALAKNKMQLSRSGMPMPKDEILRKDTLDQLINRKVEFQIAKQAGLRITDKELDTAINRIAEDNHISVSDMYQRLASEGISEKAYRDEIRNQMTLQKLRQHEVAPPAKVTDKEINDFLHSDIWKSQTAGPQEYHVEDILVPISDQPSAEELAAAKNRAQLVLEKWNKGEKLQDDKGVQGNDLGWRKLDDLPSAFAEKIGQMQARQIAGPIQTGNGFHVIRLVETRSIEGNEAPKPDRKQVEALLMQRKFEQAARTWISKMRGQSYIETDVTKLNS